MSDLHIDLETYSEVNLSQVGQHYYARHPSTRVLLLAYAFDDAEPKLIDLKHGEPLPNHLIRALSDHRVTKWAHNASFERAIIANVLKIPCHPEQWRCTMVWAMSLSLPGGLGSLSTALKLEDNGKDKEGGKLIRRFCMPGGDTQPSLDDQDWVRFGDYCLQDVRAEQAVKRRLSRYPMPEAEWQAWVVDQHINDAGLPIDLSLVRSIQRVAADHKEAVQDVAARLTQLNNPNSRDQLMGWLSSQGVKVDDLQSATVDSLLKGDLPPSVRELLECRQQMSKASLAKFDALDRATCADGRLRGAFQFAGAGRTGRFAGRIFQPQNLPRPSISEADIDTARRLIRNSDAPTMAMLYDDLSGALSSMIRSVIAAPNGKKLVVADYASIESIMIAWCAQSDYLLDLYHKGLDPYKDFATKVYHIKYEDVTKAQRGFAKPAVLGCGYGLGAKGLQIYAAGFGMDMKESEAKKQVDTFRTAYADIPKFWGELDVAVNEAMSTPHKTVQAGRFTFTFDKRFLILSMPSGRNLYYYQPRISVGEYGRSELSYMGREPGVRVGTHPGKIVENVVQAISRDLLINGLKQAHAAGFDIVGHVHDEIICLADANDSDAQARLVAAMTKNPDWCADAPVRAEAYTANYYRKD